MAAMGCFSAWYFTEEDRHALLAALRRHWPELLDEAAKINLRLGPIKTWEQILQWAEKMIPAAIDFFVFEFVAIKELAYLVECGEFLEKEKDGCVCQAQAHYISILTWYYRTFRSPEI